MKNFKSGRYVQQGHYKSFQPNPINRAWVLDNMELIQLLGQADRELGRLDMYSDYIPNIDLFIKMHVLKEATQSSKIEGTQTNMEEALLEKEDVAPDKRDDWEEVQNYVAAMNEAIVKLKNDCEVEKTAFFRAFGSGNPQDLTARGTRQAEASW